MKLCEEQQFSLDQAGKAYVCELRLDQHQRLVFTTPDVYLDGRLTAPTKTYIMNTPQSQSPEFRRACRAAAAVVVRAAVVPAFLMAFNSRNKKRVNQLHMNRKAEEVVRHYLDILTVLDNVHSSADFVLADSASSHSPRELYVDSMMRRMIDLNEYLDVGRQPPMPYDDWADQRSVVERDPHPSENDSLADAFNEFIEDIKWPYKGNSDFELEVERLELYAAVMQEIQLLVEPVKRCTGLASLRLLFREELHRYEIITGNTFDTMRALDDHHRWMDGCEFREVLLDYLDWRINPDAPRP